jgi:hypothetical protein
LRNENKRIEEALKWPECDNQYGQNRAVGGKLRDGEGGANKSCSIHDRMLNNHPRVLDTIGSIVVLKWCIILFFYFLVLNLSSLVVSP